MTCSYILEFYTQLTEARLLHAKFLRKSENLEVTFKRCRLLYSSSSRAMSDLLSTFYVKYDQTSVTIGVIVMTTVSKRIFLPKIFISLNYNCFQTCVALLRYVMSEKFKENISIVFKIPTVILISIIIFVIKHLACEVGDCSLCFDRWFTYIIILAIVLTIFFDLAIFKVTFNRLAIPSEFSDSKFIWFITLATLGHTLSLASSSFVEEEHQTWYYMTHTFLFIIFMMSLKKRQDDQWLLLNPETSKTEKRKKRIKVKNFVEQFFVEMSWLVLFAILLFGRRLNQTGDKWLNLPDIGDFLGMEQHRFWNSYFVVICKDLLRYHGSKL